MNRTPRRTILPIALAALLAAIAPGCQDDGVALAFDSPYTQATNAGEFALRSPAFADGQPIAARHSAYGEDISPALAWQPVEGARTYALVMEDPDADRPAPYVHWVAWNIPAGATSLPEGLPAEPRLADPDGMRQGLNDHASTGYFGPRPPAGTGLHHYHFQVFALDAALDLAPDTGRDALLNAMRGHVVGKARLVGTYAAPQEPAG
ncbi:YbhB/YbcL family Raf kinase inhibitor-like protein [Lysobacter sp. A421]